MKLKQFLLWERRSNGDGWNPVPNGLRHRNRVGYDFGPSIGDYIWLHEARSAQKLIESRDTLAHGAVFRVFDFESGTTFEVERPITQEPPPPVVHEVRS